MSTQSPIEPHEVHSRHLMQQAVTELAQGDRVQAAEKAWGGVAHYFKVLADQRGVLYEKHPQLRPLLRRIVEETGNQRIRELFDIANTLHANFYEDAQSLAEVGVGLTRCQELLTLLEQAYDAYAARNGA